jgi:MFS family permease
VLIASRAVQGAGAATIMPMALALLNAAFPPARRGWVGAAPTSARHPGRSPPCANSAARSASRS